MEGIQINEDAKTGDVSLGINEADGKVEQITLHEQVPVTVPASTVAAPVGNPAAKQVVNEGVYGAPRK
jgi:hypothetical protein